MTVWVGLEYGRGQKQFLYCRGLCFMKHTTCWHAVLQRFNCVRQPSSLDSFIRLLRIAKEHSTEKNQSQSEVIAQKNPKDVANKILVWLESLIKRPFLHWTVAVSHNSRDNVVSFLCDRNTRRQKQDSSQGNEPISMECNCTANNWF